MIKQIVREEGFRGFYKGLSASYLGVTEGTIQWVLYEQLKKMSQNNSGQGGASEWLGLLGSAGTAKCVASLITYPHEVCDVIFHCLRILTFHSRSFEHDFVNHWSTARSSTQALFKLFGWSSLRKAQNHSMAV